MSNREILTMLTEKFKNDKTNEEVDGITIIVDGKIKEVFDVIINKSENYNEYEEILRDAIFMGLNEITKSFNK